VVQLEKFSVEAVAEVAAIARRRRPHGHQRALHRSAARR
jgi:hypothetical protein